MPAPCRLGIGRIVGPVCQHPTLPHDTLVAGPCKDDSLDGVRSAALERVHRLVDLTEAWRAASSGLVRRPVVRPPGDPVAAQARITHRALRRQLGTAPVTAAGRQGITAEQLIERSVSGHGPASDGSPEHGLGEHRARVAIEDATDGAAHLPFAGPKGGRRPVRSQLRRRTGVRNPTTPTCASSPHPAGATARCSCRSGTTGSP